MNNTDKELCKCGFEVHPNVPCSEVIQVANKIDGEYFRLINTILKKGRLKKNRTGIDTIGVFGEQAKYDIDLNAFPILTTKKVWFKGIVHELLWFIKGDTNIKYLVDNDVHIWDEWAFQSYVKSTKDLSTPYNPLYTQGEFIQKIKYDVEFAEKWGELGYGTYGSTWSAFEVPRVLEDISPRIKAKEKEYDYRINSPKTFYDGVPKDEFCGQSISTKKSGTLTVIGREPNDGQGRPVYIVQFDKTGYTTIARKDAIVSNRVGDPYFPSVAGVGFVGEYKIETKLDKHLYKVWNHMLDRCYNPKCKEYPFYGKKGVFVCNRWLSFERFRAEVEKLPNWREKIQHLDRYQLDKDYYHSNCYAPDTCVWLSNCDNKKYQKKNTNQKRFPLPVNQLQKVIDKLKANPDDRRMIVSAWHPYWVDKCALPPCHCLFQFHTEELTDIERCQLANQMGHPVGWTSVHEMNEREYDRLNIPRRRLNCQLYQRSVDTVLGKPFNLTSYSLLTAMIAHCVNMIPGTFTHAMGDTHIYINHLNGIKEQLKREPMKLPKLWLNPEIKSLFDFKYDDIKLIDYVSHPTIKFDVAV